VKVEFLSWRDAGWQATAAMIEAHFNATHGASITLPPVELAAARSASGGILGAAGLRDARQGFFSQVYLDRPVAELLSGHADSAVNDGDILEVVSMACPRPIATLPLMQAITVEGCRRGKSWGLFTATAMLMRLLRRTGVPLVVLGPARAERLPTAAAWGRYYQADPWVCALQVQTEPLQFMPRPDTILAGTHPK
jgi:hypothetical protein